MGNNNKMRLDELLEIKREPKTLGSKKTEISDVHGIVYRIYCIPENKNYIGQTFSHGYSGKYLPEKGILNRCRQHYNDRLLEVNKDKPLYIALEKYDLEDFEVFEEEKLYKEDISLINQKEGDCIKKYNSLRPNGYNIEEIGKKHSKLLKDLCEFYNIKIEKYNYVDKTRDGRMKDVCVGTYFNIEKERLGPEKTLELLKTLDIEKITLINSNGLRIIIRIKNYRDNLRVYYSGTNDECLEYSKKISDNLVISPSFYGKDSYKYQLKLDRVLEDKNIITSIIGKDYYNKSRDSSTYLVSISGIKNGRTQTLHKVSFGGKSINIQDSYKIGIEFIEKFKAENSDNLTINYITNTPSPSL